MLSSNETRVSTCSSLIFVLSLVVFKHWQPAYKPQSTVTICKFLLPRAHLVAHLERDRERRER